MCLYTHHTHTHTRLGKNKWQSWTGTGTYSFSLFIPDTMKSLEEVRVALASRAVRSSQGWLCFFHPINSTTEYVSWAQHSPAHISNLLLNTYCSCTKPAARLFLILLIFFFPGEAGVGREKVEGAYFWPQGPYPASYLKCLWNKEKENKPEPST